jgi:hypothetical protein
MLLLGHFRQASQVTQHMFQLGVLRQVSQVTDAQHGYIRKASRIRDAVAWGLETGLTGYRCFGFGT